MGFRKKILFFAPYNMWLLHHQIDIVLSLSLTQRNCDVLILHCDGIFEFCPLSGSPPSENRCRQCVNFGKEIYKKYNIPHIHLSYFFETNDIKNCKEWSRSINKTQFEQATYEGHSIGKWIYSGVYSYFVSGSLDFSDQNVLNVIQGFLYSASLLSKIFPQILNYFYPDHVVCFNGTLAYYRIFFELSLKNNIPVLIHERGLIDNTFSFMKNENNSQPNHRVSCYKQWENVPLTLSEIDRMKRLFTDREAGKNLNHNPFYNFSSNETRVRSKLRIPNDATIVALFTSGNWEMSMTKLDQFRTFNSQLDGIKRIIDIFRNRNEFLVIRHHPNLIGLSHQDNQFLGDMLKLNLDIPENVRVIMPKEKLTSYSVIWNADTAITFGSTIGIEAIARGVSAFCFSRNIYSAIKTGYDLIHKASDCEKAIDNSIVKSKNFSAVNLQRLYRGTYYIYYRQSFKFKSIGIKNIYQADIRFKSLSDLNEGLDDNLDKLCNHILHNTPLYPVPNEELNRTDYEETQFFENELKLIKEKRERIKNHVTNFEESKISIIRIRQNAINEILEPRNPPKDTVFYQTTKRSRHKNIENITMSFLHHYNAKEFIQSINEIIDNSKGDYIYFGTDNTYVDESLFFSSVDYLEKNIECKGVLTGAWICDKKGNITGEVFTERKKTTDYNAINSILPQIKNPAQLLAFIVWKKSSLVQFVSQLSVDQSLEKISFEMFQKIFLDESQFNFKKSLIPNISIYEKLTAKDYFVQGLELFKKEHLKEALLEFDKAKILDENIKDLNFLRAIIKFQFGDLWAAKLAAEGALLKSPQNIQCSQLLANIESTLNGTEISYDNIEKHIETIDGQLCPGQDRYLFEKVKSLPDNAIVLEIGSRFGRSTASLAYSCVGTNKKLYSIDMFGTVSTNFIDIWKSTVYRLDLENYVTPLHGTSHDQLMQWVDKPGIDFVFIDSSQLYTDTIEEFELLYPLVKDNGWIAFHDVDWPGPLRVWNETASSLLSSHEYCQNLACGKKIPGKVFVSPPSQKIYYFHRYWIEMLARQKQLQLSNAMKMTITNDVDLNSLLEAEKTIALMGEQLKINIRDMINLIGYEIKFIEDSKLIHDPILLYWNALILEQEGKKQEAIEYLEKAVKTIFPNNNDRIDFQLKRLKSQNNEAHVKTIKQTNLPLCFFYTTYYQIFFESFYNENKKLITETYEKQQKALIETCFGDSDFYSKGLKEYGWIAEDFISNIAPLQLAWARENNFTGKGIEIVVEQIRQLRPQVVYLHDMVIGTKEFLAAIRPYTELIVGQIACPIFPNSDIVNFDIIFSSFPHFVEKFRSAGITSYYQPLAFEPRILEKIGRLERIYPVTFVGTISKLHEKGRQILERLAELTPIEFWGFGADNLPIDSHILKKHHGMCYGLDMFRLLAQSRITINRHVDAAENNANNMRLFEATGCGALLITDYKDNLDELFEIGKEVIAYHSPEECVELIKYYLNHPDEAQKIARAGQERTLRDHSYSLRMKQTSEILLRHLRYKKEKYKYRQPDNISSNYQYINSSQISQNLTAAWQSKEIPARQRWLVQKELSGMYAGQTPVVYQVLADALYRIAQPACSILEIGCSSAYYYEVLEYLLKKRIKYTGVDYSQALIDMARDYYPEAEFHVADGANLPFEDGSFDVAISSCILLHTPNYSDHIRETVRVAKKYVIAHRTPICRNNPTQFMKKHAYGVETVELLFNEQEILSMFKANDLKLLRSLQYSSNPDADRYDVTYIFEKL